MLIPYQAPTRPGSPGAALPDPRAQTANTKAKAALVGSVPLGNVEANLARVESTFTDLPARDRYRLATSRVQIFWRWKSRSRGGRPAMGERRDALCPEARDSCADIMFRTNRPRMTASRRRFCHPQEF